ncbi:MAG: S-layer homology domain-containing protein [Clostridiales bacterium]|nr:S-layer homology domain-containing protein [Clostridiales bacterium]
MFKRQISCLLALVMILLIMMPYNALARETTPSHITYAKVGEVPTKSYPKIDTKLILQRNKEVARSRKHAPAQRGVALKKSDYVGGGDPSDSNKPKYFGRVSAKLITKGLDNNAFQWGEIFGKDETGNNKPIRIEFHQLLDDTPTGIQFSLEINKDGTYKWQDGKGNPTLLPLYSVDFKPFKYSVFIDKGIAEKVKLITSLSAPTPSTTFKDENGKFVANIEFHIDLQQVAATNFSSVWKTGVTEGGRPQMEGNFIITEDGDEITTPFNFPKNDTDRTVIRDGFVENFVPDEANEIYALIVDELVNTPKKVEVKTDIQGLAFDTTNHTVTSGDHKYKYDFTYDVVKGGKLTMTEILPVTFDANGGMFASVTDPAAEQKIVKEVEYDGTLTDKAEAPRKDRETFKGWSTTKNGIPLSKEEFEKATKNIKEAKTFYAIWDNNEITAEELTVHESFKDGTGYVNDFIPTLETLKGQVKIKDANGDPQPLDAGDTFAIVDGANEYTTDAVAKDYLYGLLKEEDTTEVSRNVTVKAKVTHANGTSQTVDIPIKVIKNIYEAKTKEGKPVYVPDNYVKVTLDPTKKATDPQKTYYYVNPAAKVVIPGSDPTGTDGNVFTKWLIKGTTDEYKLADKPRHMFAAETTIEAQYEKEKQGIINIKYVDEKGNEIDPKYHKDGVDYPETKEGKLADYATEVDFPKPGPVFKGYIYSSRDSLKGKQYKDQSDPGKLDKVTYSYFKKVTTDTPKNPYVYFPVIFDANGGEFKSDTATQKTVYVYFDGNNATVEKVTFEEVREAVEETYGKPSKANENFIEWQDKADKGSTVADAYEIQFKGWDWEADPENGYVPEIFYAHYGKASALVKYLDLDGKPIADDFKMDGVEYPTEKDGTLGEAIASDVYTADTAPKFTGYKFNRIELNPKDGKYALDKKPTIKIYYEKVPDVIPANPDGSNPDIVPDDYVKVEFQPTDKGSIDGDKVFFVNPKKEVTIPVNKPKANATYTFKEWKLGANAEGEVYTPSTPKKFTQDTFITATYEETENIIPYDPSVPDPMPRPEGYVRVTFAADKGLSLTESKAYYVKKNAGITLGNTELAKPGYKEETGYKFKEWDKKDDLVIEAADIVVTAKATKLDNVIPEKDKNDKPNEKPEGYKEVTFVVKTGDESKGSINGVAKFYVNPTEYVTINPPATKAETGFEFGAWDKDATIPTVYKEDTTITGSFNGLKDVIPKTNPDGTENKKPDGYKTVTFVIDPATGGEIVDKEVTVYYVNPAKEVIVPQPKTQAETGYEFKEWDQDTATAKKYTADTTVKGSFRKLDDIIPSTDGNGDPNAKPEGYVTLTFAKGDHGTLSGQTVYYVNPKADPAKKLGDPSIAKPEVKAEVGYKFTDWDTKDTFEIKDSKTVVAQYEALDDVIPKTKQDESEKPKGYITVTFVKGDHGKELTGQAVYYVNPNKAVVLKGKDPKVTPETGYDFASWDTQIEKKIQYSDGDTIKALYNEKDDVIPQENSDGSDKPAGYLTVTFDKGEHGTLDGKTVYYVKPNKEVTVPAPRVKPETGWKQKDGNEAWDKLLTQTFTADNTTITAQYAPIADVVPGDQAKPDGYVTVKFVGKNGTLSGTTTYHVNPNKKVDLMNQANGLSKKADVGYTEVGGTWDKLKAKFTEGEKITFTFVALPDVIEDKPGATKPNGYVTVKFLAGTNGALEGGDKTYYVNPLKGVKIGSAAIPVPATRPKTDYEFKEWIDAVDKTTSITNDQTHVAQFVYKPDMVTLTYQATDATSGDVPGAQTVKKGNEVTLAGPNTLKKDNATFKGWMIDGKEYAAGATFTLSENTTATAVWTANGHQVSFDTNGGNYIPPRTVEHGKPIGQIDPPTKPDSTFTGWTLNGNPFDLTTGTITGDTTLVANYVPNVIPETGNGKPDTVPSNFVEVKFVPTDNGTMEGDKIFWVNPEKEVTIPVANPVGKQYFKFKEWKIGDVATGETYTVGTPKKFTEKLTIITATYEEAKNIIPYDPSATDPMPRPEGYVRVTFAADPGLKLTEQKAYYVKKNAGITLGNDELVKPGYEAETGYKFDNWDKDDSTIINADIVVTAKATELDPVIPEKDDKGKPNEKPAGYITVKFSTEKDGKITGTDETEKIVYVNPDKAVVLKGQDPEVTPNTGFTFADWDMSIQSEIKYHDNDVIKAKYNAIDDVIPQENPTGSDKPEGYLTVTFAKGEHGELSGTTVYYVKPNKEVTVPAPTVTPATGWKQKTGTDAWDKPLTQTFTEDTTITAQYAKSTTDQETKPGRRPGGSSGGSGGVLVPSTPKPTPEKPSEGDLNKDDHYQYLIGYPDGTFAPNRGMTRAEVATMFTRLLKDRPVKWLHYSSGLSDIYAGDWYADTVGYAVEKGIVSGYPDGTFRPNQPITRAEFASIASRFAALTEEKDLSFSDLDASHWGYKAIRLAASNGWISGYPDNTFRPEKAISRAEVTSITNRMLNRYADLDWIDAHRNEVIRFSDVDRSDWFFEPVMEATMGHDFTRDADGKTEHWTGLNGKTFI